MQTAATQGQDKSNDVPWSVSDLPGLQPQMLLPGFTSNESFFPFSDPATQYLYYARNGIYALARHWQLTGEEVLFPSYFHGVELEALLAAGVKPRFYPVDRYMQVDLEQLVALITPATRAVYLIHYLGFPGPVEALRDICRERNLKLIEDCALALLSSLGPQPLGTFGDASVFCLYKTLPVPTGGALVLRNDSVRFATDPAPRRAAWSNVVSSLIQYYDRHGNLLARGALNGARKIARTAVRATKTEWVGVGGQHFEIERVKLGMNRLNVRILKRQDYREIIARRRHNFQYLLQSLEALSEPVFSHLPEGVCPLFYPLRVPHGKSEFYDILRDKGVGVINFWLNPHERLPEGEFPQSDELRRTILELPCHQDLNDADMAKIVETVKIQWKIKYGSPDRTQQGKG